MYVKNVSGCCETALQDVCKSSTNYSATVEGSNDFQCLAITFQDTNKKEAPF